MATEAEPAGSFYARYWGDGRFIELAGPCSTSDGLDACLEGGF